MKPCKKKQRSFIHLCRKGIFAVMLMSPPICCSQTSSVELDQYYGIKALKTKSAGFFRIDKIKGRDMLVTPDGHGYIALGINHIIAMNRPMKNGAQITGKDQWQQYWKTTLQDRFQSWSMTSMGYGGPDELKKTVPWFGTIGLAAIEKHRSDPKPHSNNSFEFPDVFDDQWAEATRLRIKKFTAPHLDNSYLIGWFWTDTPTWDLYKTRALRGTDWVSAIRQKPADSAGRLRYINFLQERYAGRLDDLNLIYGLKLKSLQELASADFSSIAIGRHRVQEDDLAFLNLIAIKFYEVAGKAQRDADPNHLVFGDRYLAGDAPDFVLKAAAPWIDAVSVQPGDIYTPQYPPSTSYPEAEIDHLHRHTNKPVMICDHAISFPTDKFPNTIFEQVSSEKEAAHASRAFIKAAFTKPYQLGYLRCQYIDRPAGFGRGLRQGIVDSNDTPRKLLLKAYTDSFHKILRSFEP